MALTDVFKQHKCMELRRCARARAFFFFSYSTLRSRALRQQDWLRGLEPPSPDGGGGGSV